PRRRDRGDHRTRGPHREAGRDARRARPALRRAAEPEGHRHRQGGRAAARGGHRRAHPDREAPRREDLPRPAREGREGLAARSQTAGPSGILTPGPYGAEAVIGRATHIDARSSAVTTVPKFCATTATEAACAAGL